MKKVKIFGFVLLWFFAQAAYAQSASKVYKTAMKYFKGENYEEALTQLQQAIQLDSTKVAYYITRAQCYENVGKIPEATQDYIKISDMSPKTALYPYSAGRLLNAQGKYMESIPWLDKALAIDKEYLNALVTKINSLINIKNYDEALTASNKALNIKKSALNFYNHGVVSDLLGNSAVAEKDFKEAIDIDNEFENAYVALANVLTKLNKTDEALTFCNKVIEYDASFLEAYVTRSQIYHKKSNFPSAISDLTKAISLDATDEKLFFTRGEYQKEYGQIKEAINDYNQVIKINPKNYMAYYNRGACFEELKNTTGAAKDYEMFIELTQNLKDLVELIKGAEAKVYQLLSETNKPEVVLNSPVPVTDGVVETAVSTKTLIIEAKINDQSKIKSILVNNQEVKFDNTARNPTFKVEIPASSIDKLVIAATDIYNNITEQTYKIRRTEVGPPSIDIISPYTSENYEVFLENQDTNVFLQGKIADESFIKSIVVDGIAVIFKPDEMNPLFNLKIPIAGKDNITIKAIDIYGNTTEKSFKLNRESAKILSQNPMGKTWVIFIENSNYESFASLDGPTKDVTAIQNSLSKYEIHNFIHKKNLTKLQLEKFFSIELRDLVRNNKVNSIIVWYAGHGKFINETGYWIPVDANRDDEFTYFNIGSLKAAMQSYSKFITHTLVITDACESGPTFYAAMRSGATKRECGNYEATKFKSSQVFSSAGYELAQDNSQFTQLFAKSLNYNTSECIAIDNIVIQVTESVTNVKQKPQFGQIQGLEDEGGTFFFMKKR